MNFSAPILDNSFTRPLILGHFLPWFCRENPLEFDNSSMVTATGAIMPVIEPWRHWRDNRSQYSRTHMYQPIWGEYDSRNPEIIQKQIITAKTYGLDGFIINWYGKNSIENAMGLQLLEGIKYYNKQHPDDPFLYCISFDAQAQWNTEGKIPVSVTEDFEYIKRCWLSDAYILRDGVPIMLVFPYDKPCTEYRKAADQVFGKNELDLIWFSHQDVGQDASYAWVKPVPGALEDWFCPDEAGHRFLDNFYQQCSKNSSLKYIVGGIWPGFNDQLVRWAWNPTAGPELRPRIICRETTVGNTLELTWQAAIDYSRKHLAGAPEANCPMPIIQVITWNDWAESTNVEPDMDFGYKALEICKKYTAILHDLY